LLGGDLPFSDQRSDPEPGAGFGSERGFWQFSPWFIMEVSLLVAPLGALSPYEPESGVLWFVPGWEQSGL
jgi:hypothetical protein